MKRRNFLNTIAGVVGAIAVGLKIKPASAPLPVPIPVQPPKPFLPGPEWIVDEACLPDRIYLFCTPAQGEAYARLGRKVGQIKLDETP